MRMRIRKGSRESKDQRRRSVRAAGERDRSRETGEIGLRSLCTYVGMSDILAQFDIEERAEQARHRSSGGDEAILGGGGGGVRDSINPFDGPELQSPVTAVQVR